MTVTEGDIWRVMSETLGVSTRPAKSEKFHDWPRGVHQTNILYITGLDECVAGIKKLIAEKG